MFDFTNHLNYSMFNLFDVLHSANLTLTITPGWGIVSDFIIVGDLPRYRLFEGQYGGPFPVPTSTTTLNIDLLSFYTPSEILAELIKGGGTIPMVYADDAIVSFAELELSGSPVPIPSTILFLGSGLLGLLGIKSLIHIRKGIELSSGCKEE